MIIRLKTTNRSDTVKLLPIIGMFLLIYSVDALIVSANSNRIVMDMVEYITMILAAIIVVVKIAKHETLEIGTFAVAIFIAISMVLAAGKLLSISYVFPIAVVILANYISQRISIKSFAKYYVVCMKVIAIVSLIYFFMHKAGLDYKLFSIISTSGIEYDSVFLSNIPNLYYLEGRNFGPFREPGVYQAYLNIALFYVLFFQKGKKRIINAIVFSVATLTTLSGAALYCMIMVFVTFIISDYGEENNWLKVTLVISSILLIPFLLNNDTLSILVTKLAGGITNNTSNSFAYRFSSFRAELIMFIKSPIWGNTSESIEQCVSGISNQLTGVSENSITNTFLGWFARYGIVVGSFFVIRTYRMVKAIVQTKFASFVGLFTFIVLTSNESYNASLCIITILLLREYADQTAEEQKVM